MKILELTNYSAGICGVWARVKEESVRLSSKGHEVRVFSSNLEKGTNRIVSADDKVDKIAIKRFPAKKLGGESFMSWNFEQEALKFEPGVIIAHSYRHQHTLKALKIAEILKNKERKCKVFLVTHAPFGRSETRGLIGNMAVWLYDLFIGRTTINKFDKVIAITKWEIPYLFNLGLKRDKIAYIPNGIPNEFFRVKRTEKIENKILFLGRISPIKNIETAISAIPLLKDKKMIFEIVGPAEESYLARLKSLIRTLKIENRVMFSNPIYDIKEKIKKFDSANVFVLPSKSEGMPQGLIEAMARGKIVVASDIPASRDLITEGKNGFLFDVGDEKALAEIINDLKNVKKIGDKARKSVEIFKWSKIIKCIGELIDK
jgi:glycosyltransferase involved in cell wall biosynthesis